MHRSKADNTFLTGWASALLFLGIMAGLMTSAAFAAKADRSKPIDVSANEKVTDYKQGTSIYTGNVVINQGSLHATGNKATLYVKNGQLVRAVLVGNPATFQELDDKGQLVKGSANDANYLAQQHKIILTGNAKLDRQGDTLSSQQITYDMNAEVVKAGGKTGGDRVHVVIQPRNKTKAPQQDSDSDTTPSTQTSAPQPTDTPTNP